MNKTSNLARRIGTSNYYYRESVPLDVRKILTDKGGASKKEIWKSLKTSNLGEARIALIQVRAEQHNEWEKVRTEHHKKIIIPTVHDLKAAAVNYGYDQAYESQEYQVKMNVTEEGLDAELAERRASIRSRVLAPHARDDMDRLAVAIARKEKWQLDADQLKQFREFLHEAVLDALNSIVEVFDGKPKPDPQSSLVRHVKDESFIKAPAGEALLELFERYQKAMIAAKRKKQTSLNDAKNVISQFSEFIGVRKDLRSISKADVRQFREAFSAAPARWNLRKEFKGLTLTQVCKLAENEDFPRRSAKTVAKAISDISAFFVWAVNEGYAEDNPTVGLKPPVNKDEGRLPSYTPDQLKHLFESPLFRGCDDKDGKEHIPGTRQIRDWRYWIPIICLFTGARVGEIAQLRCNDVKSIDNIWIFDIQKEPDGDAPKELKNKNAIRQVPIHSALEKLGFFDYLESKVSENEVLLFPEMQPDHRKQMGRKPSRFIRTYLGKIGLKSRGLGAHSFRHTWTDECRRRGVYDAVSASILGHSKGTMTSRYGELTEGNLKQRQETIELLDFEGFDLHRTTVC